MPLRESSTDLPGAVLAPDPCSTYFIDLAVARPDTIGQMVEVNWPRISFGLDDMYSSRTCRSLDEAIEAREEAKALARKKSRR